MRQVLHFYERRKFKYVENVCWVRLKPNHKIDAEDDTYFRKSHETCLYVA